MSTPSTRTPERQNLYISPYEGNEREAQNPDLDLPTDEPQYIDDPTGEHRRAKSELAREIYLPSVEIKRPVEPTSIFPPSGEIDFRAFSRPSEKSIVDISANTTSEIKSNGYGNEKMTFAKDPKGGETIGDYLSATVDIKSSFWNLTKNVFKLGMDTIKEFNKTVTKAAKEKPDPTTPEQKAKKAGNNHKKQVIQGNIARAQNAAANVNSAEQRNLMQEADRVGARVDHQTQEQLVGHKITEMSRNTIHEVANAMQMHKKRQEKQMQQASMAQSGPTVNMNAAAEGGTGGGKANISTTGGGGAG